MIATSRHLLQCCAPVLGQCTTDPHKLPSHSFIHKIPHCCPVPYLSCPVPSCPFSLLSCPFLSVAFPVLFIVDPFLSTVAPILSHVSPTLLVGFHILCLVSAKIPISNCVHEVLGCLLNLRNVYTYEAANRLPPRTAQMILFIFIAAGIVP